VMDALGCAIRVDSRGNEVKFSDIRQHLPVDTPRVSPAERTQQLRDRSWAALGLYGY
jgi:hypothetical protein